MGASLLGVPPKIAVFLLAALQNHPNLVGWLAGALKQRDTPQTHPTSDQLKPPSTPCLAASAPPSLPTSVPAEATSDLGRSKPSGSGKRDLDQDDHARNRTEYRSPTSVGWKVVLLFNEQAVVQYAEQSDPVQGNG